LDSPTVDSLARSGRRHHASRTFRDHHASETLVAGIDACPAEAELPDFCASCRAARSLIRPARAAPAADRNGCCPVSADQRVELAREYLAGARRTGVGHLPPSVLMRECAELRRQLGVVLDVIDGHVCADRPMATDDLDPETGEQWSVEAS